MILKSLKHYLVYRKYIINTKSIHFVRQLWRIFLEKITRCEKEKLTRENDILITAEKLFYSKDYNNVSTDEIAAESEFTKQTLYKYFSSKDDLFIAVILNGFRNLSSYMKSAVGKGKNGFERIKNISFAYYQFYKDNSETFYLITQIGYLKNKDTVKYSEFLNFDDAMFEGIKKIFAEGKKDGSIQKDIDEQMEAYATAFFHNWRQFHESLLPG